MSLSRKLSPRSLRNLFKTLSKMTDKTSIETIDTASNLYAAVFALVEVDGVSYLLPTKPEEHKKPSTSQVPLQFRAPASPNEGAAKLISVRALAGRDLTPLDHHGFSRPSSDPYVKLFFKHKVGVTEVTEKNLNPEFVSKPLSLGRIHLNDNAILEVQCWDYDKITFDDFGGAALVSIAGLLAETNGHSGHHTVNDSL